MSLPLPTLNTPRCPIGRCADIWRDTPAVVRPLCALRSTEIHAKGGVYLLHDLLCYALLILSLYIHVADRVKNYSASFKSPRTYDCPPRRSHEACAARRRGVYAVPPCSLGDRREGKPARIIGGIIEFSERGKVGSAPRRMNLVRTRIAKVVNTA